ncbi:MAG TPA: hypothetical protein DCS93_24925, partial [Microscillaceae bacterium]|nr:hypothetical protein [Microscillaceae bacterium]
MKIINLKYILLNVGLVLLAHVAQSQTYGNEWIKFNQQYYKIPVTQKGIYKLSYADLINAGIPVASIKPKQLQVFHRGQEQAILVNSTSTEVFASSDEVLFYGEGNDGTQDALMYKDPSFLVNKYYNLYSDTTAYFLTWTLDGTLGKRMTVTNETNTGGLTAEAYHWKEELQVFNSRYALGRRYPVGSTLDIYISEFDIAEGWVGPGISGSSQDFTFNVANINSSSGVKPRLEVRYIGNSSVRVNKTRISVGNSAGSLRQLQEVQTLFQANHTFSQEIELSDISGTGQVVVRVEETSGSVSLAYVRLVYPQNVDMQSQTSNDFTLRANTGNKSYIEIANSAAGTQIFDITDQNNVGKIETGTSGSLLTAIINSTATERTLHASSNAVFKNVIGISRVSFRNID